MSQAEVSIDVIVSAPYMENSWIVSRRGRTDCIVVDPGFEPDRIISHLESRRLEPAMFLLTHGHVDHIAGNTAMKQRWPAIPIVIGTGDAPMLTDPVRNLSKWGGMPITSPPADRLVNEGDIVEVAGFRLEVLEIPGHSPGHVVYVVREPDQTFVIGGDVLFQGSIGRTDFPGGDHGLLIRGIQTKLFPLPDDTVVYPGHGSETTIGEEKQSNPYCGSDAGDNY